MKLTEIDTQREIYESRLKRLRDERMWRKAREEGLAQALAEGLEKGLAEGEARGVIMGRIQLMEQLLRREPTPLPTLHAMPAEDLQALAERLQQALPK